MKKPVVDYSELSLSTINQPRYSHLKLLTVWPLFLILYLITEKFIPEGNCMPVHCRLDDIIPFCEAFVIPYIFWYLLIALSLIYFLLYDVDSFRKLQMYIIITVTCAMLIYVLFPSRQDLRPEILPRDNLCCDILALLYSVDTCTGVCPSLHCAFSIGIASVWLKKKNTAPLLRACIVTLCAIICMSTMFIKQHSFIDFAAAIPICMLAELLVFGRTYPQKGKLPLHR